MKKCAAKKKTASPRISAATPKKREIKANSKALRQATAPDFSSIVSEQASSGLWKLSVLPVLAKCVVGGETTDAAVMSQLKALNLKNSNNVWATLLALFVL